MKKKKPTTGLNANNNNPYKEAKQEPMTSRLGGWPFIVNFKGVKNVRKLGSNVIKNLIFGINEEDKKTGMLSWVKDTISNMLGMTEQMKIEINITGREIQTEILKFQQKIIEGNSFLKPMMNSFPSDLALTDIKYNQISLGMKETAPYVLKIDQHFIKGLQKKAFDIDIYYRVESEFSKCNNNVGNRFILRTRDQDAWGLKAKKCGRKGCMKQIGTDVIIEEKSLSEIRKQLGLLDEYDMSIPAGIYIQLMANY